MAPKPKAITNVVRHVHGCPVSPDRTAIALQIELTNGQNLELRIPTSEAHNLMRRLLATTIRLPAEQPPAIASEKAFPLIRFEVAPGFPEGVTLMLQTKPFGRLSFVLDLETAKQIATALQDCAEQIEADQTSNRKDH